MSTEPDGFQIFFGMPLKCFRTGGVGKALKSSKVKQYKSNGIKAISEAMSSVFNSRLSLISPKAAYYH